LHWSWWDSTAKIHGRQGVSFSQAFWWELCSALAPSREAAQQLKVGPAAGASSLGSLTVLPRPGTLTPGSFAAKAEAALPYGSRP